MFCGWPVAARSQLQLLPDKLPAAVLAGNARTIPVIWRNAGNKSIAAAMRLRVYQTSSATAVPVKEIPWKKLQLLPGQTVLETARIDFPAVNAETEFLIQWLEATNLVRGETAVLVYPTNLLHELNGLLGKDNPGVLDPNDVLKPLLRQNGVEFSDLDEMALEDFRGHLAIIGPFKSRTQVRDGLTQAIQKIARKGVAVVWIQPPVASSETIKPSFYFVPEGIGTVVVVQSDLVADLAENPRSQQNVNYFCKLALHPALFPLPDLKAQP
jgi:hypothetical protein